MMSFDKTSGVVYTESTSARVGSMVPTWMSQARGKRDKKSTLTSRGKGCSSLQSMALRSCVWHTELFVPETLQWAGWHYANQIYQHLINTEALTFNAWNIFLDAYPDEIKRQQEFHVYQPDEWSYEPTQLPSIINRLAKLDTSLVTLLCIRDFSLTFDHLKALMNIPALAGMVLEQARPGGKSEINARHFKDFGRAVREKDALRKLRLLIMCDFGVGRQAILEGVSSCRSLQLIGLQNSKTGSMADIPQHTHGDWQFMTPSVLEKCGLPSDFDPQPIWVASYLTSSAKIQKLYDMTKTISQPHDSSDEEFRSVCITYGGWANRSIYEATAWFIRDTTVQVQIQKPSQVTQTSGAAPDRAGTANKKRKIRMGKQMDVGSLLGAFR